MQHATMYSPIRSTVSFRILENVGMVELSIQNAIQKSTRMRMPPASLVHHFGIITKLVMGNLKGSFEAQKHDDEDDDGDGRFDSKLITPGNHTQLLVEYK